MPDPADTISERMVRRPAVLVAVAAVLLGFVAAPHDHFHPADGVRHAHVTPHEHGHHHDDEHPTPAGDEDEELEILRSSGFVFQAAATQWLPVPVTIDFDPPVIERTREAQLLEDRQPRAHAPPAIDSRTSRAPPVSPAI